MGITQRKTKIIATLGPASRTPQVVEAMVAAGLDAARLNFSHLIDGNEAEVEHLVSIVRAAEEVTGRRVSLLGDLPGPKLRMWLPGVVDFAFGDRFCLVTDGRDVRPGEVGLDLAGLGEVVRPGSPVLLSDGAVRAEVTGVRADGTVECAVTKAGTARPRQGVHFPGTDVHGTVIGDKDRRALALGLDLGLDVFAVSFVRSADDLVEVRGVIGDQALLIAKIERLDALDALDGIIAASDGVMVARGDLGVELAPEHLPGVQKEVISDAIAAGKMAVVATEMLESMKENSRPTRAEVSDVANAALDGASAVMLSAETAVGSNPIDSVREMVKILTSVESHSLYANLLVQNRARHPSVEEHDWVGALAEAACEIADLVDADGIVAVTETGRTVQLLSAARPGRAVIGVCHDIRVARRLAIAWGVRTVEITRCDTGTELRRRSVEVAGAALEESGLRHGKPLVLLTGMPGAGKVNTLRIIDGPIGG